jgi:hypothetical protein
VDIPFLIAAVMVTGLPAVGAMLVRLSGLFVRMAVAMVIHAIVTVILTLVMVVIVIGLLTISVMLVGFYGLIVRMAVAMIIHAIMTVVMAVIVIIPIAAPGGKNRDSRGQNHRS